MKKALTTFILLLAVMTVAAQMQDPVHVRSELKKISDSEGELLFSATIDPGWHVYSTGLGDGGPISASFHADKMEGAKAVGGLKARGKEQKVFDKMFDMEVRYFEGSVTFVQKIQFTQPKYDIKCYVEYGACNDQMCMPPSTIDLAASGTIDKKPEAKAEETKTEGVAPGTPDTAPVSSDSITVPEPAEGLTSSDSLWQPVIGELQALNGEASDTTNIALWMIFLEGLLGGFLALFTPCVWPIIPMTVSFFLKRNKERSKAIREATVYGLSIVVIYVLLGLAVTLLFGASALNALATNAVCCWWYLQRPSSVPLN